MGANIFCNSSKVLIFVIGPGQIVGARIGHMAAFIVDDAQVDERSGTDLHGSQHAVEVLLYRQFLYGIGVSHCAQLCDLFPQKQIHALPSL